MVILYDFFYLLYVLLYLPYAFLKGKWHGGFNQRLGAFPQEFAEKFRDGRTIWVHAVSVGEVQAVESLLGDLQNRFANHRVVVSTVTGAGHDLAKTKLGNAVEVVFAPLDFSFCVRKFIRVLNPRLYVVAETELWPNLFAALRRKKVPIVLINGRISPRALGRYRLIRPLLKPVLDCVNLFLVQSTREARRYIALGALENKVVAVGNLKFDDITPPNALRAPDAGFSATDWVWVAGSTHPGEEDIVLTVFMRLRNEFPQLRLVLAPRHRERTEEVCELVRRSGLGVVRYSQLNGRKTEAGDVLVVDTIGHLRSLYSLAKIVFVGKSLAVGGGHNVIEPAVFGKPIIVGSRTENFRDAMDVLREANAVIEVKDGEELASQAERLLRNPGELERLGVAAQKAVERERGARKRTLEMIAQFLR